MRDLQKNQFNSFTTPFFLTRESLTSASYKPIEIENVECILLPNGSFFMGGIKRRGSWVFTTEPSCSVKWESLFSPGTFVPQMPERRRDLSPHCLLKYESIIYRQLLESKTVELYSDIAPCGGTIE